METTERSRLSGIRGERATGRGLSGQENTLRDIMAYACVQTHLEFLGSAMTATYQCGFFS